MKARHNQRTTVTCTYDQLLTVLRWAKVQYEHVDPTQILINFGSHGGKYIDVRWPNVEEYDGKTVIEADLPMELDGPKSNAIRYRTAVAKLKDVSHSNREVLQMKAAALAEETAERARQEMLSNPLAGRW
ncbi:hypothetical protein [Dyella telluris]|uniref:Uncharacterized protein n=1 Tax=Dyella telluris TaxID=2763498 RepID=A0A7G8Q4K4_9GAMM|nr:hypothetical protein [Dyella telluris]QNK01712.1 hypothetical protein H8F01_00585 [Dyella telluris]